MKSRCLNILVPVVVLILAHALYGQPSPNRVGTTAANFLELGYDPQGIAMGDAVVSTVDNLSATYWNPAGLSFMSGSEVFFAYQPWMVDTHTYLAAAGLVAPSVGTFALTILGMNYGEMEVTTMELQEGTGENFSPTDIAVHLSFGRGLTSWFGFGATIKYINSSIYHSSASAYAVDLGTIIKTPFFSPNDERDGMKIGMSLTNYGTRMRYSGLDLLRSIDISPEESGNYKDIEVEYKTDSWELPLIFRIGLSINPIVQTKHRLTLAVDALHANNNSESVNVGVSYTLAMPGVGKVIFRGGYRGLFMERSEFGPTFGIGFLLHTFQQKGIQFDYAYRDIGILGYTNVLGFRVIL